MLGGAKRTVRNLLPPVLWAVLSKCRRAVRGRVPTFRTVSTLAELDAEFERARQALRVSFEGWAELLDGLRFEAPAGLPPDPASRAYREYQMAFYAMLSGETDYRPDVCEQISVSDDMWRRPFPYSSRSAKVVGEQLMAIGYLIRASGVRPGDRAVEFGPGFGRLTLELARFGVEMTGVEINPLYIRLLREHASREDLPVTLVQSEMLDYRPETRFDRVFFYESFHHCDDHAAMIARLDSLVAPGGAVVFAGEPIDDDFPMPWGVRRDGRSMWAIRRFRWLELGFRTDYFLDLLARNGWTTTIHASADVPWQRAFVARRKGE